MNRAWKLFTAGLCMLGLASTAEAQSKKAAKLTIEDNAGFFSDSAKQKAKEVIAESTGDRAREVHIETYGKLNDTDQKEYDTVKDKPEELGKFWESWAKTKAIGDKGVILLVNKSPGHVHSLISTDYRTDGFTALAEKKARETLLAAMKGAVSKTNDTDKEVARNAGLLEVAKIISNELPVKSLATPTKNNKETNRNKETNNTNPEPRAAGGGGGIMSYLCIGLAIFAGIWLISGLFRALSGGGGGGMGGGGMGGMGGGGGGGFMSGMLGGLFGAVAGNYLYNNVFGGGSHSYGQDNSSTSANDYNSGGDNYSGSDDLTGGGNDYDAGGSDYDAGGSDFGGGGSDFGGGGDFGGGDSGGGDF
jgi:hypothetical protein